MRTIASDRDNAEGPPYFYLQLLPEAQVHFKALINAWYWMNLEHYEPAKAADAQQRLAERLHVSPADVAYRVI